MNAAGLVGFLLDEQDNAMVPWNSKSKTTFETTSKATPKIEFDYKEVQQPTVKAETVIKKELEDEEEEEEEEEEEVVVGLGK